MTKRVFLYLFVCLISLNRSFSDWKNLTPDFLKETVFSISFVNADTGFAVGWSSSRSIFLKTYNGGGSWEYTPFVGDYFFDVKAQSVDDITISGYTSKGFCGMIMQSQDGGKNWNSISFDQKNPFSFGIMNYYRKNDSVSYAIGYTGAILYTSNRGNSWNAALTQNNDEIYKLITFPNNDVGFAASGKNYNLIDRIYTTNNWGDSWELIKDFRDQGTFISNIYFKSSKLGYLCGENNGHETIMQTTDGGVSWSELFAGDALNSILSLTFDSDTSYYALSDEGKIIRTTDNGVTWTNFQALTTNQFSTSFSMVKDSNLIVYTGGVGLLYKYDNILGLSVAYSNSTESVYPNPADNAIIFRTGTKNSLLELSIYDVFGNLVFHQNGISSENTIVDTKNMTTGIYFYRILENSKKSSTGTFIKR